MARRRSIAFLLTLATAALLAPDGALRAEENASYEDDYAACRALVKRRRWAEASEAYTNLFVRYPGEKRTLERLRDIEEDLKRCLFMKDWKAPDGKALFGPNTTSFNHGSRMLRLDFPDGPGGARWESVKGVGSFYQVRFHGRLTIDVGPWKATSTKRGPVVLLCYSIEERGGYVVCPGVPPSTRVSGGRIRTGRSYMPVCIAKVVQGKQTVLVHEEPTKRGQPFTIRREHTKITIVQDRKPIGTAKDREFKGGYLGFANIEAKDVSIRGTLDKTYYQQVVSEHENRAFRTWLETSYDRTRVLPEWMRKRVEVAASDHDTLLPADAGPGFRDLVKAPLRAVLTDGDERAAEKLRLAANKTGRLTRLYLDGLAHLAQGELAKGRASLDRLVIGAPDFAPALAMRGLANLYLRDVERARTDIASALEKDPLLRMAYLAAVSLSVYDGDLSAAVQRLAEAERHGLTDESLRVYGDLVHRAHRGPLWSVKHSTSSAHFDVSSDHSKRLCSDVARQLELAQWRYTRLFKGVETPDRRARVRVFSTQEGYLRYATARRMDLSRTAGAYSSRLRELVLYLPLDRTQLGHTIRHEGFHRFIHEYLEDIPIWFDEGYAEYFGSAREEKGGGFEPGAPNRIRLRVLSRSRSSLVPMEQFFLMPRDPFMKGAELCYAQAWLVVHFLRSTEEKELRGLLDQYFLALRRGLSQREAYLDVLAPHVKAIEDGCRQHLVEVLNAR